MKKLIVINNYAKVLGKVIEFKDGCFKLNEYYVNEFGVYDYRVLCELDANGSAKMFRYSGNDRMRKLHGMFRDADYIDIGALN